MIWMLKAPGSRLAEAVASDASPACPIVRPIAECLGFESGIIKVKLGYENTGSFEQIFPVGIQNRFTPGAIDRGQPIRFFSGLNSAVFEIPLVNPNEQITWSINGVSTVIDKNLKVCVGRCIETPVSTITGTLDRVAIDLSLLMRRAAQILSKLREQQVSNDGGAPHDQRDIERARRKAVRYQKLARELTLHFPSVVKTCPEAPAFCATVDRQATIDSLRDLYALQRRSIVRVMSRVAFRNNSNPLTRDKLVERARALEAQGNEQLRQLPRFITECK
jgi:hypothetical protein